MKGKNKELVKLWLEKSGINNEKYGILVQLLDKVEDDMTVFCEINNMLDNNEETYEYNNDNIHIKLNKIKNKYILECGSDKDELKDKDFERIITGIIDIYSEVYPLGTVVEIKKEIVDNIVEENIDEAINVIILDRLVPISKENYAQYAGSIYPMGNIGKKTPLLYFSRNSIEKVIQMGYSDKEEIEFVNDKKRRVICELNLQSLDMKKNKKSVDNIL